VPLSPVGPARWHSLGRKHWREQPLRGTRHAASGAINWAAIRVTIVPIVLQKTIQRSDPSHDRK